MQATDGGGVVEWPADVVEQEPPESTSTTWTAAGGRRQAFRGGQPADDDAVFGQLVVREMRHVNDLETKLLLRHNILTMIYEARLGCLQWSRGRRHPGVQPPWPSLPRLDLAGDRRPSTANERWSSPRRAQSVHDDVDCADDGHVVIKEENDS